MAHHEVVEVDVKKELLLSLVAVVGFAAVVIFIGVTAFLRPAGDHPNVATQAEAPVATATAPEASTK